MYPHCTVRIRLLYAFNKYFDFEFDIHEIDIGDFSINVNLNFKWKMFNHKNAFSTYRIYFYSLEM